VRTDQRLEVKLPSIDASAHGPRALAIAVGAAVRRGAVKMFDAVPDSSD